jgi:hypothetical protein
MAVGAAGINLATFNILGALTPQFDIAATFILPDVNPAG